MSQFFTGPKDGQDAGDQQGDDQNTGAQVSTGAGENAGSDDAGAGE